MFLGEPQSMRTEIKLAYILLLKNKLSPNRYSHFKDSVLNKDKSIIIDAISANITCKEFGRNADDVMGFLKKYVR